ncbi:unnamed protein product [Cylicocyclus nassatus]|uniref:Uncharacterized protein n=1 Tax=Cylicocyclus nassatus TaxID=53992 RepID=A0AA36H5L8_CYLNA|nr:unnamed protein product [Cylicocyclus nassatus]
MVKLLLLLLFSNSVNFVFSQCTFGNASLLTGKLLCAKLFPLLNLCNASEVYEMPVWGDYYPLVEMEKLKDLACYKYEAGFAKDTPIMCVCNEKNCANGNDLKIAVQNIQPISLDGTAIAKETLRDYSKCLLERINRKGSRRKGPQQHYGFDMDASHPLLSWYERIIEDEKVVEDDTSWDSSSGIVYTVIFIYIIIFSFSYVCVTMCRARKSRMETSKSS